MKIVLIYKCLKKISWRVLFIDIICGLLLLLFLYTALSKLLNYSNFKSVLLKISIVKYIESPLAWGLPILEILVAVLLFFPATRAQGLYGSLIMLTVFTVHLTYMVSTESNLPCSCGGVLNSLTWTKHIFFNVFFIGLSSAGILLYGKLRIHANKSPP